jgi:hypothetical protein
MTTFSVDTMHPDRVVCDGCGAAVGAIDPCAEPAGDPPALGLTGHQGRQPASGLFLLTGPAGVR